MSVDILTSNYKAPEVYLRYSDSSRLCEYNEKVDVWSVGCVLGELLGLMCSKFNCPTPDKENCGCGRCSQRNRNIMLRRFVMFSGTSPTLTNFKNDDLRFSENELLWSMMSIVGPPSDADIKRMKCSDVMTPLLLNYVGRMRKANSAQQQALAAAAIPEQHKQHQQQPQQQQHAISPKLRLKFKGAPDQLLLLLQRLLSFDPEFRVSAGDAFVELLASAPSAPSSLQPRLSLSSSEDDCAAGSPFACVASPDRHKHPIDASVDGGHKGDFNDDFGDGDSIGNIEDDDDGDGD